MSNFPDLNTIKATARNIEPYIIRTPTMPYYGQHTEVFGNMKVWLKMELLQRTGSFKARGAINTVMQLSEQQKTTGITAFSAGNHAIATAYAARALNTSAKVVMPRTANPYRVECCKNLGAEVVLGNDIAELMDIVSDLQEHEGRTVVHPFEGMHTFAGTATVGLELCDDIPDLDAIIVPVGGGGLISGIASAVKQINPDCKVYGVEPEGAQGMSISLAKGAPVPEVSVSTIADSLGAPMHLPLSYAIVEKFVDAMVTVSDEQLAASMQTIFTDLNLAVEPACAAAITALKHPLKNELQSARVGIIMCGSNIDFSTFSRFASTSV